MGLGLMGQGMARNIVSQGFALMVPTRTAGKAEAFAADTGCRHGSPAQVAAFADLVVVCVTDSPDVLAVAEPLIAHAREGTVIVDCSTISPQVTRQVHERAAKKNIFWLDAPISGGTKGERYVT